MGKIVKIVKVNLLAILALPLLLIAVVAKLAARIIGKLIFVVGIGVVFALVALVFAIIKNPGSAVQTIFMILAVLIVFGIIIAIIAVFFSAISAIFMIIAEGVKMVFEVIYNLSYMGYLFFYDICKTDYDSISYGKKGIFAAGTCICFTILRVVNKLIIICTSMAVLFALGASICLAAASLTGINGMIQKELGISAMEYLKLFTTVDIVYGIILYIVIIGGAIIILLALGAEWAEWGKEMQMATSGDCSSHVEKLLGQSEGYGESRIEHIDDMDEEILESCREYSQRLNQHMRGLEVFAAEVEDILSQRENLALRTSFGTYAALLNNIVRSLDAYQGAVPADKFKKWIPEIQQLEKQKQTIQAQTEKLKIEIKSSFSKSQVFFMGCDTTEKLDKRYRALCKTYHPDGEAGDEETFKMMKDEYDSLKSTLA